MVAALASIALACAGGTTIEVGLQLREVKGLELSSVPFNMMNTAMLGGYDPYSGMMSKPKGYEIPKGTVTPMFARIGFNEKLENFVALLGRSSSAAMSFDRLWVDWNRDKAFSDDEAIPPETDGHQMNADVVCFGPTQVPPGKGRPAKICFLLERQFALRVLPTEVMEGSMGLGGKQIRIALVDGNLDGAYDSPCSEYAGGDYILIDQNGDGKFSGSSDGRYMGLWSDQSPESEARMLQTYAQLPDGNFYKVQVGPKAEKVSFSRDPGSEGRLAGLAPGSHVSLRLRTGDGQGERDMMVQMVMERGIPAGAYETVQAKVGKDGLRLPAGKYFLSSASFSALDKSGKPWRYTVARSAKVKELSIEPGKTVTYVAGSPMKLVVHARKSGQSYNVSLDLRDKAGSSVNDVRKPDGKMPAEPMLVIKNASGKVLKSLKFHYG